MEPRDHVEKQCLVFPQLSTGWRFFLQASFRRCLCSEVRMQGSHLAESFLVPIDLSVRKIVLLSAPLRASNCHSGISVQVVLRNCVLLRWLALAWLLLQSDSSFPKICAPPLDPPEESMRFLGQTILTDSVNIGVSFPTLA